jgi:hypothetical protein
MSGILSQNELNALQGKRDDLQREINSYGKEKVDFSVFVKTKEERQDVKQAKSYFKRSGLLQQWNERNRPGNNKNE